MKILVFGPNGYLGQQFLALYPHATAVEGNIAEPDLVRKALDAHHPDVVINAAGKTGRPNIDWCEDHKEETMRANVTGPLVLVDECAQRGIYWVHLSSGCIYEGENGGRGFTEEDPPNFRGSFYSRTKALADQLLGEFSDQILVLRLRMPFDGSENPRSLIQKLRKYPRVHRLQNSVTYMPDFMRAAAELISRKETGTFNVVNPGATSPFDIMTMYAAIVDPSHMVEELPEDEVQKIQKAGRSNCLLSSEKLLRTGISLPPVQDAVTEAMQCLRQHAGVAPIG